MSKQELFNVYGGQKISLDLLQLGLSAVVGYQVWVLGTELLFSLRAAIVLNCGAPSPAHI